MAKLVGEKQKKQGDVKGTKDTAGKKEPKGAKGKAEKKEQRGVKCKAESATSSKTKAQKKDDVEIELDEREFGQEGPPDRK